MNLPNDRTILVLGRKKKKIQFDTVRQEAKEQVNTSRQLQKHLCESSMVRNVKRKAQNDYNYDMQP